MIKKILMVAVILVVLGAILPVILPMVFATTAAIEGIEGSQPELTMLQTMWPIILMIVILGVAAGLIFWALRMFNVIGK